MMSIRDGLIQLGFYRTMYAEDKQNSIEGVYDGIYKNIFISIEIFANGYVVRTEGHPRMNTQDIPETNFILLTSSSDENFATHILNIPQDKQQRICHNQMYSSTDSVPPFSIRSESLTMQDIIHSLEKLTTQKVKEPKVSPNNMITDNKV